MIGSEATGQPLQIGEKIRSSSFATRKPLRTDEDDEEKPFNPESFFGCGFTFATV
jgi:hypothetical protein